MRVKNNISFTDDIHITEPTVTVADQTLGPTSAAVTIVNFGDYQCPACASLETALQTLKTEYGDTLRIVWKDMPNTSAHAESLNAALAAQCAGEQRQFWQYHTILMTNQAILGQELYTNTAADLDLKTNQFERCLTNQNTLPIVQHGFEEGVALGITATPTLFINNERYTGDITVTDLRRKIDEIILDANL